MVVASRGLLRTFGHKPLHQSPLCAPRLASRHPGCSPRRTVTSSSRPAQQPRSNGAAIAAVLTAALGGLFFLAPRSPAHAERAIVEEKIKKPLVNMDVVEKHNSIEKGVWVVIEGEVYDVTDFLARHPGGGNIILKNAGKDVTDLYAPIHPDDAIVKNLKPEQHIGQVDPKTVKARPKEETEADRRRRAALENLPPVGAMLNLDDFEKVAHEILTDQGWAYFSSAGDDEVTLRENRNSFGRIFFRPRILAAVGEVDASTTLLNGAIPSALPVYISPAAMAKLGHKDGELNLTRAAGTRGIVQGISANASISLDEMIKAREPQEQPLFYQLYINKDRAASERILQKVEQEGFRAVLLTVDAVVMGKRERDMRAKGEVVETGGGAGGSTSGGGVAGAISGYIDPNISWDDLKWYREHCKLPLILKGVQTVEDVELAVQHGVQGVILSNHGGRSLDYARPALEVLVELRQRSPHLFDQIEIWMDGGVRRGTDVVKALCLGATAVGLGRPFLFAQSGFGQPGAERAVDILTEEIERCMRFLGVTKIEQLGPHLIDVLPRVFASSGGHTQPSPSPPRPE